MKFSQDKEVNRLVSRLVREGWCYRRGGKHGKLIHPAAAGFLTVPGSPSDHRTIQNMQRNLRKLQGR
jgi:hypothetical protein